MTENATIEQLTKDDVVKQMASEYEDMKLDEFHALLHSDGSPRFEFMSAAAREYKRRADKDEPRLGSVAEAILVLVREGTGI
jgi:hypothetical protein